MEKMYIDGEDAILGRLGSFVAKQLLRGSEVVVINSEKVIIVGSKDVIMAKIRSIRKKGGASQKGPQMPKPADRLLKRKIRGMLPWDRSKGRAAYKRLKCFIGNPLSEAEAKNLKKIKYEVTGKYMTLAQVEKLL